MKRLTRSFSAAMAISFLTACGGDLPGFRVDEKTDTFVQATNVTNNAVDFLFVMDNSGSMQEEQAALAANFEEFITKFAAKDLSFRIGIISTDNRTDSWWWDTRYSDNGIYNDMGGSLLTKYSSYRWLSSDTPGLISKFQDNIQLGTAGSGFEMPITTLTYAVTTKMEAGEWNDGFVRDDAFFAAIFVTDEDEHEAVGVNAYVADSDPTEMESRLDTLSDSLTDLKGSTDDYGVWTIAAPSLAECPDAYGKGDAVIQAAEENRGESVNICEDFADTLLDIGDSILTAATRFKLLQAPDGDIEVIVNGSTYPRDTSRQNGWDYLADSQEIEFYGSYIPPSGASIDVNYIPLSPNE